MQPVITIDEDGATAKGRFRTLMQCGQHDEAVKNHPNPKARDNLFRSFWEGKIPLFGHILIGRCVI